MNDYEKYLVRLVAKYDHPKKIVGIVCGGGVSFSRVAMVPGSSKMLDAIWMPYSEDETITWLERRDIEPKNFISKAVSGWAAKELYDALVHINKDNSLKVAITAALTTNRHRKGDNQAFIAIDDGSIYHLKFDKLEESVYNDSIKPWVEQKIFHKRQAEDEEVAAVAFKLLTGIEQETLTEMFQNGRLKKVL